MRIVVKVGTSTLAHPSGRMNIRRVELITKVLSDLTLKTQDIRLYLSHQVLSAWVLENYLSNHALRTYRGNRLLPQ